MELTVDRIPGWLGPGILAAGTTVVQLEPLLRLPEPSWPVGHMIAYTLLLVLGAVAVQKLSRELSGRWDGWYRRGKNLLLWEVFLLALFLVYYQWVLPAVADPPQTWAGSKGISLAALWVATVLAVACSVMDRYLGRTREGLERPDAPIAAEEMEALDHPTPVRRYSVTGVVCAILVAVGMALLRYYIRRDSQGSVDGYVAYSLLRSLLRMLG